jgi:hypothetical protein
MATGASNDRGFVRRMDTFFHNFLTIETLYNIPKWPLQIPPKCADMCSRAAFDVARDTGHLLMSSLFRDYVASVRPRGEPFRSRSMVLCLAGHHPVLSIGGNARRQGLKTTFALLCPRSPGLTPRSLFGYSIVDSLIIALHNIPPADASTFREFSKRRNEQVGIQLQLVVTAGIRTRHI